jgi:hypothetical protein
MNRSSIPMLALARQAGVLVRCPSLGHFVSWLVRDRVPLSLGQQLRSLVQPKDSQVVALAPETADGDGIFAGQWCLTRGWHERRRATFLVAVLDFPTLLAVKRRLQRPSCCPCVQARHLSRWLSASGYDLSEENEVRFFSGPQSEPRASESKGN